MPVAVSRTPAAATVGTPWGPRIATVAAAPTPGPSGSWLRVTMAIRTAIESNTEAWTPSAWSTIQLRAICANTAMSTTPVT